MRGCSRQDVPRVDETRSYTLILFKEDLPQVYAPQETVRFPLYRTALDDP